MIFVCDVYSLNLPLSKDKSCARLARGAMSEHTGKNNWPRGSSERSPDLGIKVSKDLMMTAWSPASGSSEK